MKKKSQATSPSTSKDANSSIGHHATNCKSHETEQSATERIAPSDFRLPYTCSSYCLIAQVVIKSRQKYTIFNIFISVSSCRNINVINLEVNSNKREKY